MKSLISVYENRNAPVIAAFDTTVTQVEGAAPQILDANATVADVDTTRFNGGVLTISLIANAEVTDRLEFRPITRLFGVSGSNLTYRGTTVASFAASIGTTDLVITFHLSFVNTRTARASSTDNDQNREYLLSFVSTDDAARLKKRRRSR